jgi:hypothetical protein
LRGAWPTQWGPAACLCGPRASEVGPGTAPARRLEHARERSRLARHLAERTQRTTMARPVVSAQQPTDRKVVSHGIMATAHTGQARKCGWQGIGAGRRCGGVSHQCAAAVSGGSGGRGSQPRLRKLLRGGWVLQDLPRKKGGGWLGLATEAVASLPADSEASGADKM